MEVIDRGIILKIDKFSNNDAIVSVFSENHGLYCGLKKSFQSKSNRAKIQKGNVISFTWKARLAEHLGSFYSIDLIKSYTGHLLHKAKKLVAFNSLCDLLANILPERVNEYKLYHELLKLNDILIKNSQNNDWVKYYILYELLIISELGFGLELDKCVVTGKKCDLAYISPKSGKAVSKEEGKLYHNLLFPLPSFFLDSKKEVTHDDIDHGQRITDYFLKKYFLNDRKLESIIERSKTLSYSIRAR